MPKFLIERTLPGAGSLTDAEVQGVAQESVGVIRDLGPGIQWVNSFITDDSIVCVYNAQDAEIIREHARRGGFPCDTVREVVAQFDPVTAEA